MIAKHGLHFIARVALVFYVVLAGANLRIAAADPAANAAATVVVFNENDPDAKALARFYADKRQIPAERIVGLKCPVEEEITRADYEVQIVERLRTVFAEKGWWKLRDKEQGLGRIEASNIRFLALIRGMPLRIAPQPNWPGAPDSGPDALRTRNEAAVDSELTMIGQWGETIWGALKNLQYRSFSMKPEPQHPPMLLVSRLDGPTPEIVRRMITDGIAAEKEGLQGFACIDARGITEGGYAEGDQWLHAIASDARKRGSPVIFDNGEGLFPNGYPLRQTALYFGWYAADVTGPFARPDFKFNRGAVAVHIHSFSATSLRDPKRTWCAPLLAIGAAATLGNVYEPYLSLTPHLDIFHDRLRSGMTFAESAWSATPVLSWMTTVVGDPLYRPYPFGAELNPPRRAPGEWDAYGTGAKLWYEDRVKGAATLRDSAKKLRSGLLQEGLGLLLLTGNDRAGAISAFGAARALYKDRDDAARAAIHEIIQLQGLKRVPDALALTRQQLRATDGSPTAEVFRMFENQMAPPPPPPAPATAPAEKPKR
jgi:uncharacterized protein (TIGR03790 family)